MWNSCLVPRTFESPVKKKKHKTTSGRHKQDRQRKCGINITISLVCETTVVVEKQKCYTFWVRVCSLSYPARNANAPYYIVICGLAGSFTFFFTLSRKRHDFRQKKVIEAKMYILISSTIFFFWNISHSKKNWARCQKRT